jgi:hypothetical protein
MEALLNEESRSQGNNNSPQQPEGSENLYSGFIDRFPSFDSMFGPKQRRDSPQSSEAHTQRESERLSRARIEAEEIERMRKGALSPLKGERAKLENEIDAQMRGDRRGGVVQTRALNLSRLGAPQHNWAPVKHEFNQRGLSKPDDEKDAENGEMGFVDKEITGWYSVSNRAAGGGNDYATSAALIMQQKLWEAMQEIQRLTEEAQNREKLMAKLLQQNTFLQAQVKQVGAQRLRFREQDEDSVKKHVPAGPGQAGTKKG